MCAKEKKKLYEWLSFEEHKAVQGKKHNYVDAHIKLQ